MPLSLFDHHRRLHDLEVAVRALLDLLIVEAPAAGESIDLAARTLRARGEAGAARLLAHAAGRSYAR